MRAYFAKIQKHYRPSTLWNVFSLDAFFRVVCLYLLLLFFFFNVGTNFVRYADQIDGESTPDRVVVLQK